MKKESREIMEKKFEKLSDANKIRYNLGRIMSIQFHQFLVISFLGMVVLGCLCMLPFMILYAGGNRLFVMAVVGCFSILIAAILFWVGVFKLNKSEKVLEDFLNKRSKK